MFGYVWLELKQINSPIPGELHQKVGNHKMGGKMGSRYVKAGKAAPSHVQPRQGLCIAIAGLRVMWCFATTGAVCTGDAPGIPAPRGWSAW